VECRPAAPPTLAAVKLRVLGSNATYPTPGRPASGYLVRHGGTVVMVDAGPGTVAALQEAVSVGDVDGLVISHVHPDHCSDVYALFNLVRFGPDHPPPLTALAPEGAVERLSAFLGAGDDHDFHRLFTWQTARPGERTRIGEIELSFGGADHSVPALVTRFTASGRSLVYSGDTGPGGDLAAMARGADVLLCEATFQGDSDPWPFHLSAHGAAMAAQEAGVGRLMLTHVAPILDPQRSVAEAREVFDGPVEWAAPGMKVMV
jgi:ribonuclease BN (tRNA processing enzyme)